MDLDSETRELIKSFVEECREAMLEVEPILVGLEEGQESDVAGVTAIFRLFHSVKGTAGFLGLETVERVTHNAEEVLQAVRDGDLVLDGERIDLLCETLDFTRDRLVEIERTGTDAGAESEGAALAQRLESAIGVRAYRGSMPPRAYKSNLNPLLPPPVLPAPSDLSEARASGRPVIDFSAPVAGTAGLPPLPGIPLVPTTGIDTSIALPGQAPAERPTTAPGVADAGSVIPDAMLRDFQVEARELLGNCEAILVTLERGVAFEGQVEEVLRLLHSFKGNCGYAALDELEQVAHSAETALGTIEVGQGAGTEAITTALLAVVDLLRRGVDLLPGSLPPGTADAVLEGLELVTRPSPADASAYVPVAVAPKVPTSKSPAAAGSGGESVAASDVATSLRVDVTKLDLLMDLVGELIISVTGLTPDPAATIDGPLGQSIAQLSRVTNDLQSAALSLRMIPVDRTFRKMIRLVRDVSRKTGHKVALELEGGETEVDKSIAEVVADPLVHLLRNAVDHGIEDPATRLAAGKSEQGTIKLSALPVGGEILIRVEDDGRGLDRDLILAKARRNGLIEGDGSTLSDEEVFLFIFKPGFSTAKGVSDISGRGMGMDIVQRNIESISGRIKVESTLGEGTRFTIRIPLTLAIIEGMLVRVGASHFTIPLLQVRESVVASPDAITVLSNGQEIVKVRDEFVPVVRLHAAYDIDAAQTRIENGILVVVENGPRPVCLLVDELVGQRQTVVKSLSGFVGRLSGVAGCTVLADGRISLILDILNLVQSCERGVLNPLHVSDSRTNPMIAQAEAK